MRHFISHDKPIRHPRLCLSLSFFGCQILIYDLPFISSAITTFKLNVTTQDGPLQIPVVVPAITLGGRESKVVVTDYTFGSSSRLLFSTAQIFYASTIDKRDI